ncbi:hypothetical protein LIER_27783 [Lithospermum erythrorhizon]|uniref:Uncharacterized protein n=1 Tax=Lithospermum erythrorhizon TaxID=34254 RepID=A0AAV3REG5_LITER
MMAHDLKKAEERKDATFQVARSSLLPRQPPPLSARRCWHPVGFCPALPKSDPVNPCPGGGAQEAVPDRVA